MSDPVPSNPPLRRRASSTDQAATKQEIFGSGGPAKGRWLPQVSFNFKIISIAASKSPASSSTSSQKQDSKADSQPGSGQAVTAVELTILTIESPNAGVLRSGTTLAQLRTRLKQLFPTATPFAFCNEDGAVAPDNLSLNSYFAGFKNPPALKDTTLNIYVTAVSQGSSSASIAALLGKNFLLKFLRVLNEKNSNIEASLDSSIFKGKDAGATTMNVLRGFVKSMSVDSRQDIFCLPDGTPIQDNIPLEQYLIMAKPNIDEKEKVPSIPIFLKKTGLVAVQPTNSFAGGSSGGGSIGGLVGRGGGSSGSGSAGIDQSVLSKLGKMDLSFTDRSAQELHRDKTNLTVTETLREKDYAAAGGGTITHANKLNEADWDLILKNCNACYGWIIDFKANKMRRAPHAAFRLRKGLNLEKVKVKVEAEVPIPIERPPSAENSVTKPNDESTNSPEPKLQPLQVDDVKEYMPRKPQGIPSFSITDDTRIDVAAVQHEFSWSMAENHFDKSTFEFEASGVVEGLTIGGQAGFSAEKESGKAASKKEVTKTLVATYKVPRVTVYLPAEDLEVTDEFAEAVSRIRKSQNLYDLRQLHKRFGQIFCSEIMLGGCLQTSKTLTAVELKDETMSRSKFKGNVGLAVGFPGVASGSMKASHENQDQNEDGNRDFNQRENLSFSATGGNTILAADPPTWLTSVGSDFNSWRVVGQSQLNALMDIVSDIAGYEEVKIWFLQAVPKLTEYIVIPPSRTVDARFKVLFQLEGLSRALAGLKVGKDEGESRDEDIGISKGKDSVEIQTYFAHNPSKPPTYIRTFVDRIPHAPEVTRAPIKSENGKLIVDVTTRIYQTVNTTTHAVFQPSSTQAPVLIDPRALPPEPVTRTKPLAGADPAETPSKNIPVVDRRTVWRIEVPNGYSLMHNSLVSIKSLAKSVPGMSLSLTIYRNAQGVFMPTITSSPEPVYWRVLKASPSSSEGETNQLKYGDAIRLCWCFSDQSNGWRDYKDDYYGRRRFDRPAEFKKEEEALYLKAPFPRFEPLNDSQGMSLVMSNASTTNPILQRLTLREQSKPGGTEDVAYNLFDLTFRLDHVGNNGDGEYYDYMNVARADDTFDSQIIMQNEWVNHEVQSALDVGTRIGNHVANTYVKQFDNIANAISTGSPGDIVKETFKGALMVNPVGALTKIIGLW